MSAESEQSRQWTEQCKGSRRGKTSVAEACMLLLALDSRYCYFA